MPSRSPVVPVSTGYTLVRRRWRLSTPDPRLQTLEPLACTTEGTHGYSIDLTGGGSTGNLFGFVRQATISGTLFDDPENANGTQDAAEGAVSPVRNVYLLKGSTQVASSPFSTGSSFTFGAQDVGATYASAWRASPERCRHTRSRTQLATAIAARLSGANPVGWQFVLTSDRNTALGSGGVDATRGSCSAPFGNLPLYRILLNSETACIKDFIVSYKRHRYEQVCGTQASRRQRHSSRWSSTSNGRCLRDGTQIELQYDDTLDNITPQEMLHCKIDPRVHTSLIAPPVPDDGSDPSSLLLFRRTQLVFPAAPPGYDATWRTRNVVLDPRPREGRKVPSYVYSAIDGLRDGT